MPPYWDPLYSGTWRYAGPHPPYTNAEEYEAAEPVAFRTDKIAKVPSALMQVKSNGLPPYWDGHYSNTWRYSDPHPPYTNADEWEADEPKDYRTDKIPTTASGLA